MNNKKINAVEFLTALVVIDGHTCSYGVRSDCTQAFADDVCHRAVYYNHAPYEVRFTGMFYLVWTSAILPRNVLGIHFFKFM